MCARTYIESMSAQTLRLLASLLGFLGLFAALATPSIAQTVPNIAAASDLRLALTDVAAAFKRDTGQSVSLTFGSSGNFYRQLQQGAPFEMFLSADEDYVLQLAKAGKTAGRGAPYAVGRLALVAAKGSALQMDSNLDGLRKALQTKRISRFAIANPAHAPYGKRAEEALRHARLWQPLTGKLVLGENVSQALQFATEGGARGKGGVQHQRISHDATLRARYALIPAAWHRPLRQRMALMKSAGPVAQRFYRYVQQPAARRIFVRYGFALPGEVR